MKYSTTDTFIHDTVLTAAGLSYVTSEGWVVTNSLPQQFNYHVTYLLVVSPFSPSSERESPVHSEGIEWLWSVTLDHSKGQTLSLQGSSVSPEHLLVIQYGQKCPYSTEIALAHTCTHMHTHTYTHVKPSLHWVTLYLWSRTDRC